MQHHTTANRVPARLTQDDGRQSQPHTPKAPTVEQLTYEYDSVELAKEPRISESCPRNWLTQAEADERGEPSSPATSGCPLVSLQLVTIRMRCSIPAGNGRRAPWGPTDQAKAPVQGASRGVREVIRCR